MSVIVRNPEGNLLLLCKGADSVMFERLGVDGREFEDKTREHVNEYADAGLRTLLLAYRILSEEEYNEFNKKFTEAKNTVSGDRDALIDEVSEIIKKDLILLGATTVEDKLQNGVPDCIDKLAQAGIKIWVLTCDKMETAINIEFACSLLSQGMKQIMINLDSPEIKALEKAGDKSAITQASREGVQNVLFSWLRILGWMVNGVISAIMIFYFCTTALEHQAFNEDGKVVDFQILGATKYTFIVWASIFKWPSQPATSH